MAYLPAVLGTALKGRVLERLLRRGPASIGQLALDVDATRQRVAAVVDELALLGVVRDEPGEDRRERVVHANHEHPFVEPLRVLAVDGAAWYETPETWERLLAERLGHDWYVGGYAAVRRVMQPIDFESPSVLLNVAEEEPKADLVQALERAAGIRLRTRRIPHVPPEVVPLDRGGRDVWYAAPDRGFVEAWALQEIPLYGLLLCLVQGLHDRVLHVERLLAIAPAERVEGDVRALLAAVQERVPVPGPRRRARTARALRPEERAALDLAINTVVG